MPNKDIDTLPQTRLSTGTRVRVNALISRRSLPRPALSACLPNSTASWSYFHVKKKNGLRSARRGKLGTCAVNSRPNERRAARNVAAHILLSIAFVSPFHSLQQQTRTACIGVPLTRSFSRADKSINNSFTGVNEKPCGICGGVAWGRGGKVHNLNKTIKIICGFQECSTLGPSK